MKSRHLKTGLGSRSGNLGESGNLDASVAVPLKSVEQMAMKPETDMQSLVLKSIYLIAGIALFFKAILVSNALGIPAPESIVSIVVRDTGVPNAVSGIIFRNRLYDTIFEVVVFTIAILGCNFLLATERPSCSIIQFNDKPSIVLARLGSTIVALVAIELSIRGHLSPGGGFAAGVAGGTAIGLIAMTSCQQWMQALYIRWRAAKLEKVSVLVFIVLSMITLMGIEPPQGDLGALISGGIIPILNIIVALKVALGSWAVLQIFIRYRGLL